MQNIIFAEFTGITHSGHLARYLVCTPYKQVNDGQQGLAGAASGRQVVDLVWIWRVEVSLRLPEVTMAPGKPALRLPCHALRSAQYGRLRFHSMPFWFSTLRSMTQTTSNLCRFQTLTLCAMHRLCVHKTELCLPGPLRCIPHCTICSVRLCVGDNVPG